MTTENSLELSGQVALVTGGGRGIGRAIASTLSAAGAIVAVLARSASEVNETARIIEQAGGCARPFVVDVTDAVTVERTFAEIERSLGPVTLLVNNAAVPGPIGPFWDTDPEQWWRTLDVNLRGAMLCTRVALRGMIARSKGRIINIASSAMPVAYFSSYATSKAALVRFTETIAGEVKPYGVSTFAVGPGTVRTAMAEHSLRSDDGRKWLPWFKRIFDEGLDVSAERPARLVLELASGRADSLSGRFLSIWDDLDSLLQNVREIEEHHLYSLRVQTLDGGGVGSALTAIRAEAEHSLDPESQVLQPAVSSLRIQRTLQARAESVFRAWSDPKLITMWFPYHADVHWRVAPAVPARVGEDFLWTVAGNGDSRKIFSFHGVYRQLKPTKRVVFTWNWDTLPFPGMEAPGSTLVTVQLDAQGRSTLLTLTQTGFTTDVSRNAHEKGWNRCLDGIEFFLRSEP